ncbi:lysophospholipid acyltransferase 5-like [Dysidea avara]|uniref:lysophospholipid acyltransferase 5-like n=1 Tax=Dysidea avara TaxID=196820 RepID=UPI0033178235
MGVSFILSDLLGMPEPALRMLVALLSAYPVAFLYHILVFRLQKPNPLLLHGLSVLTGPWMVHYLTGTFALHFLFDIVLVYIVLRLWPGSRLSIALTWIICGTHTLAGYTQQCINGSVHNPLNWTIPQCVLLMKLVGLLTDIYDGAKKKQDDKQQPNALSQLPTLPEFLGFSCFFGNVLIGPQLSFKRYIAFTSGSLYDTKKTQNCMIPGLVRCLTGIMFVSGYGLLGHFFPSKYLVSDEYANLALVYQWMYLLVWGRVYLWMYTSVWILVEGACIITGISYDGVDESGAPQWGAVSNIHVLKFESSYTLQTVIDAFNITSSRWTYQYVYTRLKWLRSKPLSHFITLLFLAMWHGLWPGYFITFTLEFILIVQERQLFSWLKSMTRRTLDDLPSILSVPITVLAFLVKHIIIYFPVACFCLLTWEYCWKFMVAVRFYLFFVIIGWAIFNVTIVPLTKKHRRRPQEVSQQQQLPPPRLKNNNEEIVPHNNDLKNHGHVNNIVLLSEE